MTEASWEFAANYLALDRAMDRPGGPALFDAAVTNGLVAIVATHWPEEVMERRSNGTPSETRLKAAAQLLDVLDAKLDEDAKGRRILTTRTSVLHIDTLALRAAIQRLAPLRHGRGSDRTIYTREHDALDELARHPELRIVDAERQDARELEAIGSDADDQARAGSYFEMLSVEEVARRVSAAEDLRPIDPKKRYEAHSPQFCPVCEQMTLIVRSTDSLGMGIGTGTCFVCSYDRGELTAELEARHEAWLANDP